MVFQLRGKKLIFVILITSGMDFLLFGYDQGLFGGILAGTYFQDMLGHPSPTMSGLVTAIYDVGCALGAIVAFVYGEKIGRKKSIILANFIVIVGAALQTASYSYWQMFAARIVWSSLLTPVRFPGKNFLNDIRRLPELVLVSAQSPFQSYNLRPFRPKIEAPCLSYNLLSSLSE
jgi:MFS family permease